MKKYVEDQIFERVDFSESPLSKGDYENCTFLNCDFSNSDLSGINFSECEFKDCNLSLATLTKTAFQDIQFKDCKLLGLRFDSCNEFLFSVYFDNCILNLSSFYKLNLKNTKFKNAVLQEVDFTESDLSNSIFENCDLAGAIFENTGLEKVDFRSAYNYSIDPELNRIKKARFSTSGIAGLLHKYDIEIELG